MTHTESIDDEINLWQIAEFLMNNAKLLLLGGIAGAVLGFGGWFALVPYKGELVVNVEKLGNAEKLSNTEKLGLNVERLGNAEKPGNPRPRIDYMTWRNLEQTLPLLALQIVESGKIKDETLLEDYKEFSKQKWWQQNVVPTYALTKADTKSLFVISKELQDAEANTILNFVISDQQGSKEGVLRRLNQSADFIQQGGAFLAISSLISRYELEFADIASMQQQIAQYEVELRFLRERAKKTEMLRVRFPQSKGISSQQVLEIKDSNAKFMPIESQLIAVYSDIDKIEEQISRLTLAMSQLELKKQFVKLGAPLLNEGTNGLDLTERLVGIASNLQDNLKKGDQDSLLTLRSIHAELIAVRTRFGSGLTKNPITKPIKSGVLIPVVGGFMGAGFVMLMWLILRQGWMRYRGAVSVISTPDIMPR